MMLNSHVFYNRTNFFSPLDRRFQIGLGKNQNELLAPQPTGDIAAADTSLQQAAEAPQNFVPGAVTIGIIKTLEMINIEHHDPNQGLVTVRPVNFTIQGFFHKAAIKQVVSGSRIDWVCSFARREILVKVTAR